jgi:hypothetical protein
VKEGKGEGKGKHVDVDRKHAKDGSYRRDEMTSSFVLMDHGGSSDR